MTSTRSELVEVRAYLARARNADGGWGYQPGGASRLEPTCWALLALGAAADGAVLERWPSENGLLLERRGGTPNYGFHGLALLALKARRLTQAAGNETVLAAVQRVKGVSVASSGISRQDASLQGWSWIPETFSWVEPTAWCLLALKQWSREPGAAIDGERVDVAERLLVDRCCAQGGWNYGNSNMLGQELKPFVPTTAIALLALQDRPGLPEVVRSIAYLEREATSERSGTSLALALLALKAFDRTTSLVRDALLVQLEYTMALGKHAGAAMALYALNEGDGHAAVVLR